MADHVLTLPDRQTARIRFAVRQLRGLTPGLAQLPLGLALLSLLAMPWLLSQFRKLPLLPEEVFLLLPLGLLIACLVSQQAIKRWYTRRLGQVMNGTQTQDAKGERHLTLLFVLLLVGLYGFEGASGRRLPFEPGLASLALMFAVSWLRGARIAPHQGALAALLLIGAALVRTQSLLGRHPAFSITALIGLAMVVQAICDHLLILRALHPLPEEPNEDAVP